MPHATVGLGSCQNKVPLYLAEERFGLVGGIDDVVLQQFLDEIRCFERQSFGMDVRSDPMQSARPWSLSLRQTLAGAWHAVCSIADNDAGAGIAGLGPYSHAKPCSPYIRHGAVLPWEGRCLGARGGGLADYCVSPDPDGDRAETGFRQSAVATMSLSAISIPPDRSLSRKISLMCPSRVAGATKPVNATAFSLPASSSRDTNVFGLQTLSRVRFLGHRDLLVAC